MNTSQIGFIAIKGSSYWKWQLPKPLVYCFLSNKTSNVMFFLFLWSKFSALLVLFIYFLCPLMLLLLLLLLSRFSHVRLCDPIDGSPPGSPVPGILQARTLEWVASSFSNAWKWKVKVKSLSRVRLLATPLMLLLFIVYSFSKKLLPSTMVLCKKPKFRYCLYF